MATRLESRADDPSQSLTASGAVGPVVEARAVHINITHELATDMTADAVKRAYVVKPSDRPTLVTVESTVVSDAARRMNSPEYLATVRRRKSLRIKIFLESIGKKAQRDNFGAFVFKVVEEIRELILQLTDVQREGNTREILRQLRDTFLNGGYERYRDAKARGLAASILQRLSELDEVTPDDVDQVWDELFDSGLAAPLPAIFTVDVKDDGEDG